MMNKIALTTLLVIISFMPVNIFAQVQDIKFSFHDKKTNELLVDLSVSDISAYSYTNLELRNNFVNTVNNKKSLNISKVKDNVLQQNTKKKSVLMGIGLSLLVPGAGEFYAKSYIKSAIFFAVEALAWTGYFLYENKGDNQTEKFEQYADTYWSVKKYGQWLKDEGFEGAEGINPDLYETDPEQLRQQIIACEQQNFSHTMPIYKSQQFYELIGKYQNFQAGWTNLSHTPTRQQGPYWFETYRDPVFLAYANERQLANDYYKYAKTGIFVVALNHILSAADAAWSVKIFNDNLKVQTGFEIKRYRSPFTGEVGNLPSFNLSVNF